MQIFPVLVKVHFQNLCVSRCFESYIFTTTKLKSVENTVKHLKMPNICSNFIRTGVGPAKDKSPRKGTAKNAVVLLKVSMYI